MERKDSCPAVSHIWSLIAFPSMCTKRAPNSTPAVREGSGEEEEIGKE
jgi:hypothetical protein